MAHRDAARHQGIGDQLPVAPPPDRLGAHHRGRRVAGDGNQLIKRRAKRLRFHVIGVAAKPFDPPGGVPRVAPGLAHAAERRAVPVDDRGVPQRRGQRIGRKMRMPSRARDRSDVHKLLDAVGGQQLDEIIQRARRMPNGVDHRLMALRLRAQAGLSHAMSSKPLKACARPLCAAHVTWPLPACANSATSDRGSISPRLPRVVRQTPFWTVADR